ncbi:MAG TPA: alpha-galactosidase [Acidimicrobiales bacterium]|nr:alpha-galactosidase [Acidimicrobiales bacterium]
MQLHRLRNGDLTAVVDVSTPVPTVVHWGPDPGPLPDGAPSLLDRGLPPAGLDREPPLPLVGAGEGGDPGRPGLLGCRPDGAGGHPRFAQGRWSMVGDEALRFEADAGGAGLRIEGEVRLGATLTVDVSLTNTGDQPYLLERLAVTLPVPADADEVLRFDGRWCAEMTPARCPWEGTTLRIENRRGRTSHDHVPVVFAGRAGFGELAGSVHGVHVAWSGNAELELAHRTDGRRTVQAGEVLAPGEVVLAPGETYQAPTVHGVWGDGLNEASRRFHAEVRAHLPARPRPVTLNTWEAVYFDHDASTLRALADRAAAVGVERFVLDDGWFGGRRDDTAGLGDWWVSPDAHPQGLAPLIDHVRGLGMEFGIWVEPEMVNPDSDLYRAHPDWVLGDPEVLGRNQLVLDLSIDACWQHLHDALHRLLADHDIAYVKWDMNRDLAGAGAHRQVQALYRLLDALGDSHPDVEIESCASGGGRADLAILRRTCRIWASDCNDALERQVIQRGWSHLLPPAVTGAHIGPPRAHTTGRTQRLAFRAATALFGHLGIEWNLLDASERHLEALTWWIDLHKRLRPLLHGGDVVRLEAADPANLAHGVVAPDRSEALFAFVQLTQSRRTAPATLRLAGLDPDRTYRVEHLAAPGEGFGWGRQPAWLAGGPVEATGRWLMAVGLQPPLLLPESASLVHLSAS